jgi:hypothetical protein
MCQWEKKDYTLSELMNELIAVEGILKAKASVNMAQLLLLSRKAEKRSTPSKLARELPRE